MIDSLGCYFRFGLVMNCIPGIGISVESGVIATRYF